MDITVVPHQAEHPPGAAGLRTSDGPERFWGLFVLLIGFGGFGLWAGLAPIDNAAIAPGVVEVESSRKTVQHLEGGIVQEILVREGVQVRAGDLLLRLEDTEARAQFEIVRSQYLAYRAEEARLVAERDELEKVVFPQDLLAAVGDARVDDAIFGQRRVFQARQDALQGEIDVLHQRVDQIGERIVGLDALMQSKVKRIGLYHEEIGGLKELFLKGMGDKSRLREWERLAAELDGERAD